MSVFRSRPALRWLVPSAAAVIVIGGGATAGVVVASAESPLPDRSAAQLLVDMQNAKVDGLSGTVVQSADLGIPALAALTGGGSGGADLTKLITSNNTAKVWYAGEQKMRLSLSGALGQTDVIRNGADAWMWSSKDAQATHFTVPASADGAKGKPETALPSGIPSTPQEAADQALAAIDPTTAVSTTGAAKVAGRNAYELVLSPKDAGSLIGQVRLAIDAEKHIPLRVDVYAKNANSPAVRVAFQQISFAVPDAQQFVFKAPAGTKVTEADGKAVQEKRAEAEKELGAKLEAEGKALPAGDQPKVIGKGWTSILTAKLPAEKDLAADGKAPAKAPAGAPAEAAQLGASLEGMLDALPEVNGSWGSGRLLTSSLFTVLLTDDGHVYAGAVTPEALYQAVGK